jgi:hypothetical protein
VKANLQRAFQAVRLTMVDFSGDWMLIGCWLKKSTFQNRQSSIINRKSKGLMNYHSLLGGLQ